MTLEKKLSEDLKTALKAGDVFVVGVLRLIHAALQNKAIEKRGKRLPEELADEEVLDLLGKEVKKRQDAIALYVQGKRQDLADKEQKEIGVIKKYLPAQLSKEEVERIVTEILTKSGALDIGSAMKAAMSELKGKADAKMISDLVREKLGK